MADQIRATPRSPILGLFSDLVNLPLQYMSSPERTQQSQGVAQFLYGTGIPKTLDRLSYGDSLFSGAGGLGGSTRMRPETAEALLNVAPFAPVASRVAGRMIKATEGLPVGMGIKDVGKGMVKEIPKKSSLLDMTRTPSEAEIKKLSREDLINWLQNNDPNGQYLDPTPNPAINLYRTSRGYNIEDVDTGRVFEFGDYNKAKQEFDALRYATSEFQPMTLKEAQESAINYLREFAQPAESGKVLNFTDPFGNTIGSSIR